MLKNNEDITILMDNYQFIQDKFGFRFSVDAVLLSDFFLYNKKGKILDIGTGNGIIPILLSIKNKCDKIIGVDIQKTNCEIAKKNVALNKFNDKIDVLEHDIKKFPYGNSFEYIISNPPYMTVDGKQLNFNDAKTIARHEVMLSLEELISNVKRLLKPIGSFTFVHQSHRFGEICCILEKYGFSIKRVKFVHFSSSSNATLVLLEAFKGKKYSLTIEPPIFLEESDY